MCREQRGEVKEDYRKIESRSKLRFGFEEKIVKKEYYDKFYYSKVCVHSMNFYKNDYIDSFYIFKIVRLYYRYRILENGLFFVISFHCRSKGWKINLFPR